MASKEQPSNAELVADILPAIGRLAAGTHTTDDTIAINVVDITIRGRQNQTEK